MRLGYLFCLLCAVNLVQADEEMQRWKQQQMQMLHQQDAEFTKYKTSIDTEFQSFLEAQWREMALFKGNVRDETPKPKTLPTVTTLPPVISVAPSKTPAATPPKISPDQSFSPLTELPDSSISDMADLPVLEPTTESVPKAAPVKREVYDTRLLITFLGVDLVLYYDRHLAYSYRGLPDSKNIADYWRELSGSEFQPLIEQLQLISTQQRLNDWGYLMLIHEVANSLHPGDESSVAMLSWFLLIKSGIQSRVGYNQHQVFLFMPSQQQVYEQGYLYIDDDKYYVYFLPQGERLSDIYTYDGEYPAELRQFDFVMQSPPTTAPQMHYRQVDFSYAGASHNLSIAVDQNLVGFYDSYPQLDIEWYFNAPVGEVTRRGLLESLRPVVGDMSKKDALNLILGLVQSAFPYQTDDEQFGTENYLLPEETLFYPYSDCEDRSVLFAWLVKHLLEIEVIGLSYPGHVATAVKIAGVEGDGVNYRGDRFVIADPTYVGARVGMAMPNLRAIQPGIILMGEVLPSQK